MDLVVSANNNEEVMVFPFVPPGTEFEDPWEYEEFKGIKGTLQLIGESGLRVVEISAFWPVNKNYAFVHPKSERDGNKYVEFFKKWQKKKVPIRLVMYSGRKEIINMACTFNLKWSYDKVGDISYSMIFKEYWFV